MLSRVWKFTLAWVVMAAIALQGAVAPTLAVPYDAAPPTLAVATQLPQPDPKFTGKVGTTYQDSVPSYPQPIKAPADSPNVLLILLDDVGFGMTSTFGGPVPTPNLDKLAQNGVSYTRFHTTALCSPTRGALLTGRNHHSIGTGVITELGTGSPGYTGIIPKSTALVSETLKDNGYATAMFGKWHNTPEPDISPAGPFDRWPTGLGFDYFYGFNQGEAHQYYPTLYRNTVHVDPPATPEEGYHFTADMTDEAIAWTRNVRAANPDKPWFVYFSTGAIHAPHHVPPEWREKFKGQFDYGWDKQRQLTHAKQLEMGVIPAGTQLTPRPAEIPAWDSLTDDEKTVYTTLMENYAGFMAHTDYQWTKQVASHFGGTRNPMVVHWPNGIQARGEVRTQFHHVIDVVPTILEAAHLAAPQEVNGITQKPIEGVSMAYSFEDAAAAERHTTQYFEMFTNRAIYDNGWTAVSRFGLPWDTNSRTGDFEESPWELYNIEADFSQAHDLAAENPAKLKQLQAKFLQEAKKYDVLPLDPRFAERLDPRLRVSGEPLTSWTYFGNNVWLPEPVGPQLFPRGHTITAQVDIPKGGADGVIACAGGFSAGWSLFVKDGKPNFRYTIFDIGDVTIPGTVKLPEGEVTLKTEFIPDGVPEGAGTVKLYVNDQPAGEGHLTRTLFRHGLEPFEVGRDSITAIAPEYKDQGKFEFTGQIEQVAFALK